MTLDGGCITSCLFACRVLEDHIVNILPGFESNVEECAKYILKIPCAHDAFESVVVGVLMSEMLRLPRPRSLPVFYFRVFQRLIDLQRSMRSSVEACLQQLLFKIHKLDEESFQTLNDFFAYYLTLVNAEFDFSKISNFLAVSRDESMEDTPTDVPSADAHLRKESLDRFLRFSFEKLARYLWYDTLVGVETDKNACWTTWASCCVQVRTICAADNTLELRQNDHRPS